MEVIKQLQNPNFRFLLLNKWDIWGRYDIVDGKNKLIETQTFTSDKYTELEIEKIWTTLGKAPVEGNWTNNNYNYNDKKLIEHMKERNIGIIGGYGDLRILDIDDIKYVEYFKKKFSDTLIIQSGTGGIHIYIISADYSTNFNLKDKIGEYRAENRYVVAPNCTHPNGNQYKVINDTEIKIYDKDFLQKILQPFIKKDVEVSDITNAETKPKDKSRSGLEYRKVLALIRKGLGKEEIFEEMKAYSKWLSAPEQYKEHTYNAAIKYIKAQRSVTDTKTFKDNVAFITNPKSLAIEFCKRLPTFYDENRIFWMWNKEEYRWEKVDETTLLNKISDLSYYDTINHTKKGEIIEALKQAGRKNRPIEPSKYWIQFKDKIIDVRNGDVFDASPKYFIFNPIPWSMGKSDDTPTIDKFLKEWVVGQDGRQTETYVDTMKEIIAYCCLPWMPINRIICLKGDGANGKSTYLRLLSKILGVNNITASTIDRLTKQNFELSKLFKKLAIIITEIDNTVFKKTAIIKALTGEDPMSIEYKGKDPFDFYNYAKPIMAVNELPETKDKTKGFYRRWTIIDFPNTFKEKADILNQIPDTEIENLCNQIPKILKKLVSKCKFTNDGTIEEREIRYNVRSTPIREFINEMCETGEYSEVKEKFGDLFFAYTNFLSEGGYESHNITKRSFGQLLNTLKYPVSNEKGIAYRKGLRLKDKMEDLSNNLANV